MHHPSGESSYLSPLSGYYDNEPTEADHSRRYDLTDAQASMERMRLAGRSPLSNSPSSGGEGGGSQLKEKDRSSKKSRSSSSLGFSESRYFILKGLNEEDLKLSVQYGLWATQDHLVPILNDAFEVHLCNWLLFICSVNIDCTDTFALNASAALDYYFQSPVPVEHKRRVSCVQCKQERGVLWLCTVRLFRVKLICCLTPLFGDATIFLAFFFLTFQFLFPNSMTSAISSENSLSLEANEAWKPSIEIPLSPEMRASLVEEYEQANKEGRQLTNEEAETFALGSTTTTSWGILFTVEWIHV